MQKKNFLMQFLIFFCYELSVCPLIFKSDKVYFASSLIAKPTADSFRHYFTKAFIWLSNSLEKTLRRKLKLGSSTRPKKASRLTRSTFLVNVIYSAVSLSKSHGPN